MTNKDIPTSGDPATESTTAAVRHGLKIATPLIIGYVPVAFAFGVLGRLSGLPDWATVGMSLFVYGGASQFAALALLATGNLASIITTTFIINLRHMLLAASISPRLRGMNLAAKTWFSVELTDEAFALHDGQYRRRPNRPKAEIFAANGAVHLSWVAGTMLGILFGSAVPGLDRIGLDFALVAMFIAILFIDVIKTRHDLLVAALGGLTAVVVTVMGAEIWATVIATLIAATIGWSLQCRQKTEENLA